MYVFTYWCHRLKNEEKMPHLELLHHWTCVEKKMTSNKLYWIERLYRQVDIHRTCASKSVKKTYIFNEANVY